MLKFLIDECLSPDLAQLARDSGYAISQTLGGSNGPGNALAWAAEARIDAQLVQRVADPG